ncbi:MAG: translation initiation factor IF-2 [Lachnospiraceae bacterium]|nr:translation initiation factor IF-2 [Lachnospiraceae bacterium]
MAKIKVFELAKELDIQSKDVLGFLKEKGIEAKAAQSSVEEDAADMVRKAFGAAKNGAETKKEEVKSAPAPAEKTVAAPAEKPAEKAKEKEAKSVQPEADKNQAPKKKKIIIVSNNRPQQSQNASKGRPNQGNNTPNRGGFGNNNNNARPQAPVRPIKPLTPPSPTPSVQMVPSKNNNHTKKPSETKPAVNTNENTQVKENVPVNRQENTAQRTPSTDNNQARPANNNRKPDFRRDNNGGNSNNNNNNQGRKPFNQGAQSDNRGQRPTNFSKPQAPSRDQKPGRDFPQSAPAKDEGKKRDDRRFSQEKDSKKSKKDLIYENEENVKNKPGRFIKPDKKKEEVVEEVIKVISLPDTITIKDLADKIKMQPAVIIKKLFLEGKVVTVNQEISYEDAENIVMDYDILCEKEVKVDIIEEMLKEEEENPTNLVSRPPVICVMGHVDHGKTSLLDAIRKTNVIDKEAGGITQHIGAYTVNAKDRKITFLDTPGHEAFTAMRMRGANSTDIAILVVAADDGVMPQTVEAINHAKAAGIEIIVAVNKIDKPSANIERVKQELTEYGLVAEDWGGSTVFAPVSAKSGEGIENLLDMILLTADILELKANPNRKARGLVIEAEPDKGRGPVATVLVQKGTLRVGDFISAGAAHGKVRAMIDDKGRRVKEAGPSTPVEILGLSDVPSAGEVFLAHDTDKIAKSFADTYLTQNKEKKLEETKSKMSLDDLFSQIKEGNLKELNLIVKADVQGSVEAVKNSLVKLSNEEIVVKCIHGGVGAINESDVTLASASNAIIIGFNVRVDATAKTTAEREGVDVRLYKVIYQAIEDVEAAMKGMLDPVYEEKVIGHAEIRQIFKASAIGNIAGSYVLDGEFKRGCKVRITREGDVIFEGDLASLKRFKDDVKEVKAGFECGLVFDGFDKIQELDQVEAYIMVEVPR